MMELFFYTFAFLFAFVSLATGNILYLVTGISFATIGILIEIYKRGADTYHLPDKD